MMNKKNKTNNDSFYYLLNDVLTPQELSIYFYIKSIMNDKYKRVYISIVKLEEP